MIKKEPTLAGERTQTVSDHKHEPGAYGVCRRCGLGVFTPFDQREHGPDGPTLKLRKYRVSLTGNDIFQWSRVIESRSYAGAINEALQIIDGATIEQIAKVEAEVCQ